MSELVSEAGAFIPKDRIVSVGEKSFDLSEVPFEYSLRFYEMMPIFEKMQGGTFISSDDYNQMFPVIYDLFHFIDESVEEKWLRKKITIKTFTPIMMSIFFAVFDDGKKNGEAEGAAVP
jgi:predicted glycoside hydrolase/deacetylase ChbG (UPF0249 family)